MMLRCAGRPANDALRAVQRAPLASDASRDELLRSLAAQCDDRNADDLDWEERRRVECGGSAWVAADIMEGVIRRAQADPALRTLLDELFPDVIEDLVQANRQYQHDFAKLYAPGLAAMRDGDVVSAAPGPEFGTED